jgi:hypothetical protein
MPWKASLPIVHRLLSLAVAIAAPVAIYVINGTLELWTIVLGAVIGFGYWYFFPFILP